MKLQLRSRETSVVLKQNSPEPHSDYVHKFKRDKCCIETQAFAKIHYLLNCLRETNVVLKLYILRICTVTSDSLRETRIVLKHKTREPPPGLNEYY